MLLFYFYVAYETGRTRIRLANFLERKGLTQQALADELDIPRNTVWRWVNGKATPSAEMLQKLAYFFNVPVDELLNGPVVVEFRVTLKYVKTLEGVDEEMNMNGIALTIAEDGFVGVSGGKKFENYEDIERVVEVIRKRLTFGFEHKDEMKE
jgi:transcriptional regulator with XRE-family HTH domain